MSNVQGYLDNAKGFTTSLVTAATSAMTQANSSVQAVGYSLPVYQAVTLPPAPASAIDTTLPTLTDVTLTLPTTPTDTVVFQDISAIDAGSAPTLTAPYPTINLPTAPGQVAPFGGVLPAVNTNIAFPDPPSTLLNPLIDVPVLSTYVVPAAPQVTIPAFTSVAPVDTTVAPTNLDQTLATSFNTASPAFVTAMDGYVDAMLAKRNPQFATQMAAIEAQLTKYLAGGTALNPDVENAIYARARTKNNAETLRASSTAYDDAAARGFSIPNGALLSAIQTARQAGADNNAAGAREIVVMQAEMEQKNLQFAVTTSTGLRTALLSATLSYHSNIISLNGQALDYAKSVVNSIVEVYNTAVKVFTVKLEAYKTDAQVYEVRLRGALAGIEIYKAEIDALRALVSVDEARVNIYRARIEALVSLSNVYRAQVEAVMGRVSLEKLKLEVFQGQVQAYTAQVQAKNAEWSGYSAAINGEEAKVQIYAGQVNAYSAQVNGYRATVEAKAEAVKAQAITNQARAERFRTVMAGYSATVAALGDVSRTKLENQRQVVVAYQAKVQAAIGAATVAQGYYKVIGEIAIQNAQSNLKAQLGEIESKRAYGQTLAQLGTANAQVYGNLASSAMAGMNTLASETITTAGT